MLTTTSRQALALSATLMISVVPAFSQATTPTAEKGHKLSVFATGVTGQYTAPDSIAVFENHIYIAYGDGNDPSGQLPPARAGRLFVRTQASSHPCAL